MIKANIISWNSVFSGHEATILAPTTTSKASDYYKGLLLKGKSQSTAHVKSNWFFGLYNNVPTPINALFN